MYEDIKEYLNWYDTRKDMVFAKDAPIIGLVLQRSHLVTGDEGHYSGVVSEMEARGAKVGNLLPICCLSSTRSTTGRETQPQCTLACIAASFLTWSAYNVHSIRVVLFIYDVWEQHLRGD